MSNVLSIRREVEAAGASEAREYLGPARVTTAGTGGVEVELPGGAVATARLALAFPYRPVLGDLLLVIGRGPGLYVIGVLEGGGETVLSFRGGVELRAEGGPLRLSSDEGVHLRGPEVDIQAGTLRMAADGVVQKFASVYQRVTALLSVRAREVETLVEGASLTRARSASILTEETMSINGKQIHLG